MLNVYIVFGWLVGICYGFVLMSSAQHQVDLFKVGEGDVYTLHATVLLSESKESAKNVGFFIGGSVGVWGLWGQGPDRLLKLELRDAKLHIRSRKAPSPDGFIPHSSHLDNVEEAFYAHWRNGQIAALYLPPNQPIAFANLKRGVASLLQFQLLDGEVNETDASGSCEIQYQTSSPTILHKTKIACDSSDLPQITNSHPILNTITSSNRAITYELSEELTHLRRIISRESHGMRLSAGENLGSYVQVEQTLTHVKREKVEEVSGDSLEEALAKLGDFKKHSLVLQKEDLVLEETLTSVVNDLRENLQGKHLGSVLQAKAFLKVLNLARNAPKEEVAKILNMKKNNKIIAQIFDVLGYVQREEIHEIVMKKLHLDQEDLLDLNERYLWALSLSTTPDASILKDLLNRYRKSNNLPEKIEETLLLTLAAMARKVDSRKVSLQVEETILNGLDYATGEERLRFLRALKNLQSPRTIPKLLEVARSGTSKEGVLAFKALKALDPQHWDSSVLKAARKAFLQLDRKYDSSSRTLSIDILLEQNGDWMDDVIHYMKTNDSSFEVKQYLYQKLTMLGHEDFFSRVKNEPNLHNYHGLAPRGLSTAFKRSFVRNPSVDGSLLTVQEMSSGIVKRGIVNVMMEKNNQTHEIFSLGIFAGGLGSFMSSSSDEDEDDVATAGMELTILDTQIRPFVFFTGQGELMGHVWSGTASERTTAFQSTILLQDHLEYVRLGVGFVAELKVTGAVSFDLSGKIEISIWSRTADAVVEKRTGVSVHGLASVNSAFVQTRSEFSASVEPQLALKSDMDFSGKINLCMRVTQPDSIFRHNTYQIERIPGSKHKIRLAKYRKSPIPGTTYVLNRKNNQMCSAMFP